MTGSGRGHSARGFRQRHEKVVECFESFLLLRDSHIKKDYFTPTVVSCDLQNPLGA